MPKILTTWFMNDPQLTHQAISMRQQRKVFTFFHFHPTESPLLLNGGKDSLIDFFVGIGEKFLVRKLLNESESELVEAILY